MRHQVGQGHRLSQGPRVPRGRVEVDAEPRARSRDEDREPYEPPSEIQTLLEDAGRVARQRTFGTIDDTLDPVEICAGIARFADELFSSDDIWSQEQVDQAVSDAVAAVELERDAMAKERDAAIAERKIWEEKAEADGGKAEQLEVDLAEALDKLARAHPPDREAERVALGKLLRSGNRAASELHVGAILDVLELVRAGVVDDARIATCAGCLDTDGAHFALVAERDRANQLESFLEETKAQLRRIIDSI